MKNGDKYRVLQFTYDELDEHEDLYNQVAALLPLSPWHYDLLILCVDVDEEVLGCLAVDEEWNGDSEDLPIEASFYVRVKEPYQRDGLATRMIDKALNSYAEGRTVWRVRVSTGHERVIGALEKCGFKQDPKSPEDWHHPGRVAGTVARLPPKLRVIEGGKRLLFDTTEE